MTTNFTRKRVAKTIATDTGYTLGRRLGRRMTLKFVRDRGCGSQGYTIMGVLE
jgi:hypothetical protein